MRRRSPSSGSNWPRPTCRTLRRGQVPRRLPYQRTCIRSQYRKPCRSQSGASHAALASSPAASIPWGMIQTDGGAASSSFAAWAAASKSSGVSTTNFSWWSSDRAIRARTTSGRQRVASCLCPHFPAAWSPCGPLPASLGLIDIRSAVTSRRTVPAVSIVTCSPAARSSRTSVSAAIGSSGSPPVRTTWRVPEAIAVSTSPRTLWRSPSGFHEA